jgi:hypothetical protein
MIPYVSLYPFAFHVVPGGVGPLWMLLDKWGKTPGRGDFGQSHSGAAVMGVGRLSAVSVRADDQFA